MPRFLVGSDLHARPSVLTVIENLLENMKKLSRRVDAVIFGGDMFHDRTTVHSLTYLTVFGHLASFHAPVYIVSGNHDQPVKDASRSVLEPFDSEKIRVYSRPGNCIVPGVNLHFLPYGYSPSHVKPHDGYMNVLVAHSPILGAKVGPEDYEMLEGIPLSDFPVMDLRLFGHHHKHQKLDENSYVIGAMFPTSFGESWEDKGPLILDISNSGKYTIERIDVPGVPKYYDFVIQREDELEAIDSVIDGNFVRVKSTFELPDRVREEFTRRAYGGGFSCLVVKPVQKKSDTISLDGDFGSFSLVSVLREYLRKYTEKKEVLEESLRVLDQAVADSPDVSVSSGSLEFHSLSMENFGPHVSTYIDLEASPLTLIQGVVVDSEKDQFSVEEIDSGVERSNGAGKSWILRAIYWALTGEIIGGSKRVLADDVIRDGAKSCRVRLDLSVRGQRVQIERCRPHKLTVWVDGAVQSPVDVESYLQDTILRVPKNLWQHLVLLGQQGRKLRYYLELEEAEQRSILDEILGMSRLKQWQDFCVSVLSEEAKKLTAVESMLSILTYRETDIQAKVEQYKKDYVDFQRKIETAKSIYESELAKYEERQASLLSEIQSEQARVRTAEEERDRCRSEIEAEKDEYDTAKKAIEEWERVLYELKEVRAEKRVEYNRLATMVGKWVSRSPDAECPECEQRIPENHINKKLLEYTSARDAAKEDMDGVDSEIPSAVETITRLKDILRKHEDKLNELERLEREVVTLSDKVLRLQRIYDQAKSSRPDEPVVQENNYPEKIREAELDLDGIRTNRTSQERHVEILKTRIAGIENLLSALGYKSGKGVRLHVYAHVQDVLNRYLYEYCSALSDGKYTIQSVLAEPDKSGGYKEKLAFNVVFDTGIVDGIHRVSKGQEKRMDLAILLAYRKLYSDVCGVQCNVLFVDEIFDGLDRSGTICVSRLLLSLGRDIPHIYVISHDHQIQSLFQERLICVSVGGNRTVVTPVSAAGKSGVTETSESIRTRRRKNV